MELKELLAELDRSIRLAPPGGQDPDLRRLKVDGMSVLIRPVRGATAIEVGASPGMARIDDTDLLKDLLDVDGSARCGGAISSIDAEHRIMMRTQFELADLEYAGFKAALEHFLAGALDWRARLAERVAGRAPLPSTQGETP